MKNVLKLAVLGCTALSLTVSQTAFAAVTILDVTPAADPAGLSDDNLAIAQTQCDAAAATADLDGPSPNSDTYTADVVEGLVSLVSGPTEVGTHTYAADGVGAQTGAGTFTPAHKEILGDPYRNGGSVNMFGVLQTVGGHYSNSSYNFRNDFDTVYGHAYTCTISKEVYHAPVHHNQVGHWVLKPDFNGNEEAATRNCVAFNQSLPNGPANGGDPFQANCEYIIDTPAYDDPATWDAPVVVATNVPGATINQTQRNELLARESFGEGFDTSETLIIGQVVVCISPSKSGTKLPGAWTKQNGYTGDKCTTVWYNGGATVGVPNLNDGSHNFVTVPVA